jgi:hypothetical protein
VVGLAVLSRPLTEELDVQDKSACIDFNQSQIDRFGRRSITDY